MRVPAWGEVLPLVFGLLLLGILFGLKLARWGLRRRGRRVARRGARGEDVGIVLLRDAGFEVLDTQVRATARVEIDGESTSFDLWLDAIAAREGRRYVAEFKTGGAASMGQASTRRQLLEYALAMPGYGLVFVDASGGVVHEVEFPQLRALTD